MTEVGLGLKEVQLGSRRVRNRLGKMMKGEERRRIRCSRTYFGLGLVRPWREMKGDMEKSDGIWEILGSGSISDFVEFWGR